MADPNFYTETLPSLLRYLGEQSSHHGSIDRYWSVGKINIEVTEVMVLRPAAPGDPTPTGHVFEPHEQEQLKQGDKVFCQKVMKSGQRTKELHEGTLTQDPVPKSGDVIVKFLKGNKTRLTPLSNISLGKSQAARAPGRVYQVVWVCNRTQQKSDSGPSGQRRGQQRTARQEESCKARARLVKWKHDNALYADFSQALCGCGKDSFCGCAHNHPIGRENIVYQSIPEHVLDDIRQRCQQTGAKPALIAQAVREQHSHGNLVDGLPAAGWVSKITDKVVRNLMDSTENNHSRLHEADSASVRMWAECMQRDGSLLAFKEVGSETILLKDESVEGGYVEKPVNGLGLAADDFMLSFQTPRQAAADRMKEFMEKFIATDSTHHTTKFNNYQLFVMLVADEQNRGEPVSYSLQSSGGHQMLSVWLGLLKGNGLDPNQIMQDCDPAESLAFRNAFGDSPKIFYCIWHVLKAVRGNMGKCRGAGRLAGPHEKFGGVGTSHGDELLEHLVGLPCDELLEHLEHAAVAPLSAPVVGVGLGQQSQRHLVELLVKVDSNHKPLSDGDLRQPGKQFQNQTTIRREARARGIRCARDSRGGFALDLTVQQLFGGDVSSKPLLGVPTPSGGGVRNGGADCVTQAGVWDLFKALLMAPTRLEFEALEKDLLRKCHGTAFKDYYVDQWQRKVTMWALYGMEGYFKVRTNMFVESFNKVLKIRLVWRL